MAEVHFTSWLRQVVPDGPLRVEGVTVGDALGVLFSERPHVRGYVLDEHGRKIGETMAFAKSPPFM